MSKIKATDVGVVLERIIVDPSGQVFPLTGATLVRLYVKQPDRTVKTLNASLSTDGSDGKVRHTTTATSFTQVGHYQAQVYFEFGSTQKYHTDWFHFDVEGNIL